MSGTLWLVATPIGNLGDLPPRAVDVLASCGLVCCEDTRRTGKLLQHAGLRVERLAVANDHTELRRVADVLSVLGDGRDVAVVTDAGTPGISDPGERLVRAAIDAGYAVSAVPGPAAVIVALTISGLPTARYVYEGFIPRSGRDRTQRLAEIAAEQRTVVLYEAPHRLERTMADLLEVCGPDRRIAVCRELTKMFEEVLRGTLGTVDVGTPRGEYVLVIGGAVTPDPTNLTDDAIRNTLRDTLATGATTRDAVAAVSKQLQLPKRQVYALAIDLDDIRPSNQTDGGTPHGAVGHDGHAAIVPTDAISDNSIMVRVARPDDPELAAIIATHVATMDNGDTPADACHRLDLGGLLDPSITFFAAYAEPAGAGAVPTPVGIGAFALRASDWGEVKSMHVLANHRGRGISHLLLAAIEQAADDHRVHSLRLETGRSFTAAIALYEQSGFVECPPFGDYVDHPASLFMEKRLS